MTIGILAFHGDVSEHREVLRRLGAEVLEVRTQQHLSEVEGLVIPGGESTTVGSLLEKEGLLEDIRLRSRAGKLPILGTCAGAILLAKNVLGHPRFRTLDLLEITIDRNAYGTQLQSFEATISVDGFGRKRASFIRSPRIIRVGQEVEILAEHRNFPVLVRSGDIVASTFHSEVWKETWLHEIFLERCTIKSCP